MTDPIRVGTRRSALARIQTDWVVRRLARVAPHLLFEARPVDTSGDRNHAVGSSPDFTDTIDRALLRGEVDIAVHSAKDLPAELDSRFELLACPRRADPRDCLVVSEGIRGRALPRGVQIGSSSLRRRAQLLRWRPDLRVVEVRGNVDTRIGLVRTGQVEAVALAVAGVSRLGRREEIDRILPSSTFLPAPAQGALAVVGRSGDRRVRALVRRIDHPATRACVLAERAFSAALGGDCNLPLGTLATVHGSSLSLTGEVLTPDGRLCLRGTRAGPSSSPERVGTKLGREMRDRGALGLMPRRRR